jgi:peptidylprolyl isomerase
MLVPLVAACGSDTAPDGTAAAPVTSAPAETTEPVIAGPIANQLGVTIVDTPVPAVEGATDLDEAPTVAAGEGAPPSGTDLVVVNLVDGDGEEVTIDSTVVVQYLGTKWSDGSEFDSTWSRGGEPTSFAVTGVIPGFAIGLEGMKVGGRRLIVVPPDLGYGPQGGSGDISATDTIVFVVDLVEIEAGSTPR